MANPYSVALLSSRRFSRDGRVGIYVRSDLKVKMLAASPIFCFFYTYPEFGLIRVSGFIESAVLLAAIYRSPKVEHLRIFQLELKRDSVVFATNPVIIGDSNMNFNRNTY